MRLKYVATILLVPILLNGQSRFGLNLSGGTSFPTGEFSDYYQSGFHGSISGNYNLHPLIQISLTTGYSNWSIDEEKFQTLWREISNIGELSAEGRITAIPLLISFKYFIIVSKKFKSYFQFAGGIHFLTSKLEGNVKLDAGTILPIVGENINRTETTLNFGIGAMFQLSKIIWLDLNGRFHLMNDSEAIQSPDNDFTSTSLKSRTLQYVSIMAGLDIFF